MSKKETISDIDSSSESEDQNNIQIEDLIENEPLYHVLAEFLQTSDNKNITTVLNDICTELKLLRVAITEASSKQSS